MFDNKILKPILAGIGTMLLCIIFMTAMNLIPREAIQTNSEISAIRLHRTELFHYTMDDFVFSEQDNYADAKWMSIVYSIDPKHPFTSAIIARYAQLPTENIDDGFYKQVQGLEDANNTYSRYWHGAMAYIRPLLLITDLYGIRIILGCIIVIEQMAAVILLWIMKKRSLAVCYGLAFLSIHPWMLFLCLEYSSVFLVASDATLSMLLLIKMKKTDMSLPLFTATGVLACFFDFLTTETISFTVPMLFLLIFLTDEGKIKDAKDGLILIIKNGIAWFLGYAGAFITKLALVLLICGKDELIEAFTIAAERINGEVYVGSTYSSPTATTFQRITGAIWHNVSALFSSHAYNMSIQNTILMAGATLIISIVVIYLFRTNLSSKKLLPMLAIALLPYARYIALSSHSYVHYFFTYRAQLVTVTVLIFLLYEHGIKNIPFMLSKKGGRS